MKCEFAGIHHKRYFAKHVGDYTNTLEALRIESFLQNISNLFLRLYFVIGIRNSQRYISIGKDLKSFKIYLKNTIVIKILYRQKGNARSALRLFTNCKTFCLNWKLFYTWKLNEFQNEGNVCEYIHCQSHRRIW